MRIEHLAKALKLQETQKTEAKRAKAEAPPKADQLNISDTAKALHQQQKQVEVAQTSISRLPDVREARLDAVAQRIAEGYYNRPEVITKITEAVLKSGVMDDAIQARSAVTTVVTKMDESPEVRNDAVQQAKSRAADGTYDRPEVIQKVAEEILKNFEEG